MRVLFAFTGGSGHAEPLVPLARAAEAAGHTVAFTGRPTIVPMVEALGFTAFPTGTGRSADVLPERIPPRPYDPEEEARVLREGFAGYLAPERAAAVRELCREWRPDVVVCDEVDFGAMVAAESLAVPHATVLVVAAGFVRADVVAEPLDALRREYGLEPDPGHRMPARLLALSPFPPSFRDPAFPLPATARSFRTITPGPRQEGTVPLVYFTLGTMFNVESGDLFQRVLAGLGELPVDVVVTLGRQLDPAELEPLPANVRAERYVPQAELLPRCAAVVSHGGSGSVVGTLAHGLPSVLLPMGADQPLNAARCETLGVGRVLDPLAATPADVRDAVAAVLGEPGYRRAAERLRDELAALPGPADAVRWLEAL